MKVVVRGKEIKGKERKGGLGNEGKVKANEGEVS